MTLEVNPVRGNWSRRDNIAATVTDLVSAFTYYDRKECEVLPRGSIQDAIAAGEVTVDEIADLFRRELAKAVR